MMAPPIVRYGSPAIVVHWLLAATVFAVLGLGWYLHGISATGPERAFYLDLHISLALTGFIGVVVQLFFRLVNKPIYAEGVPLWRKRLDNFVHALIYITLIFMLISGYLEIAARGLRVHFWGLPLPLWRGQHIALDGTIWLMHGVAAWLLSGLIVVHILLALLPVGQMGKTLGGMLHWQTDDKSKLPQILPASKFAKLTEKLASNHRILGWLSFWIQLLLAIATGLLLSMAISGGTSSLDGASIGNSKIWAGNGFYLLCVGVIIAFYYTKAAVNIALKPDFYFDPKHKVVFWFLGLGMLVGLLGILVSFAGVATSILLLISKTISQPPGIAITNPTTIIRALDVFVLLVNFILLVAHFVGSAASFWLGHRVIQCRHEYLKIVQ